jgi:predicted GNAT family acetyltransferase
MEEARQMKYAIPKSLGGSEDIADPVENANLQASNIEPIESRINKFAIPESLGGSFKQEAPAPVEKPKAGVMDIFTGADRIAATPELGTLPEFGSTAEGDALLAALDGGDTKAAAKISAGFLSTASPEAQLEIIQSAIPDAVFETTPDGSTIIETKTASGGTRRSVLNRPGFSPQDLTTSIAQVLAFIPSAKIATLGKTLLQKVGLGTVTAGATAQGLQEVGIAGLGRETRDPTETAIATGLGGAAEVVMPAIQAVRGMRQTAQVGAAKDEILQTAQSVKAAQEATKETGIPLFKAQQTGIPAQLEKQSFVAQLPAGTRSAVEGLKAQNKAAGDAVENFLGQIAPDSAVVTGAERIRTAAQTAIQNAKNIRSEKASPIYTQAFKDGADVDTKPLSDFITSQLDNLPETGEIAKTLKKVIELTKGKAQKAEALAKDILTPINKIKSDAKEIGVSIATSIDKKNNAIEVSKIVVPDDLRNVGIGTKFMSDITKAADESGSIVTLTPSKDFGGNVKKLIEFYKRLGFVENKGANKDFRFQDSFIRLPSRQASVEPAKDVIGKPSLELLHNAKIEIDQMLKGIGENSLGNTTKAKLTQAKDILLQQMDDASPGYTAARQAFADASPAVTKIQDSIIGKVAKLNDDQLKQVSNKIFSPAETNPAVILNAKKAIQDVDPEAWSQIVRVELEKRLGSVKSTQEAGTVDNLPGQLYRALFPNEKSTKILMNSLDAEGKKNLTYLQTALSRARLGRPGGSQTAVREEIKKELRGGIAQAFRNFVRAPISSASSVLEDTQFNSRVAAMAKALYDTTWKADMKNIRALDPSSPAAARAMTQLLNDIQNTEEAKK